MSHIDTKKLKITMTAAFALYIFFIIWTTVLKRVPNVDSQMRLELFWSYRDLFSGKPGSFGEVIQNLGNILFFVPFGFLFPLFKRSKKQNALIVLCGFALSLIIEVIQYRFKLGLAETDDVICNTLGTIAGVMILSAIHNKIIKNNQINKAIVTQR